MARYMLDTDISSYIIKKRDLAIRARLAKVPVSDVCISVITKAELLYGVARSSNKRVNRLAVDEFLTFVRVLPWDDEAAEHYAEIRAMLEASGAPIGNLDMMIAAHARSCRVAVVTNNERHFRKVQGLRVDNWLS
jgi:tRNA(fMet)-specific endonuclease VapC